MSSSKKKPSKTSKKKSATPTNLNPIVTQIPTADCYVPMPVNPSMQFGAFPSNWAMHQQYVNNWVHQPSPPLASPPLPSPTQASQPSPQQVAETQRMINQARRILESDSDCEEEEEEQEEEEAEEEEVQEVPAATDKGKGARLAWNDAEVRALGEAWVDCSQKAETGINQTTSQFKTKVWQSWCRRMGAEYRNPESIYSKWRSSNKGAMEFQGCYSEVVRQRPSGAAGDDIMSKARLIYSSTHGKEFTNEVFWRAVKDYEKWKTLDSADQFVIHLAKKHKSSASPSEHSTQPTFDLNADEPYDPPHPMGRDQSKRKMRAGKATGISSNNSVQDDLAALSGNVGIYKEAQQVKENALKIKEKIQLRKILMEDISGKTGFDYDLAVALKKDAARQLGLNLD